jgi:hypothetical protein
MSKFYWAIDEGGEPYPLGKWDDQDDAKLYAECMVGKVTAIVTKSAVSQWTKGVSKLLGGRTNES